MAKQGEAGERAVPAILGACPILPTPFLSGGVDVAGMARLAGLAIGAGAGAVVYPGVASEDIHLAPEERRACLDAVVRAVDGRVPVISGVNHADPARMAALARDAVAAGADLLMAMAIPAMRPDMEGWYGRIAEAGGGAGVILQNMEGPRGAALAAGEMLDLARAVPAIRWVKQETVPSGAAITALVEGADGCLDGVIGGGGARYLFEELERGVCATMPALDLIELHVALMRAHAEGRREAALALWERSLPLLLIQAPFRMRMTKMLMKRRGLIETEIVRETLPEIDDALRALIIELDERWRTGEMA